MGDAYYQKGFIMSILLLVGFGTAVHSMIDFEIAHVVILGLIKQKDLNGLIA
jgi:niacin transporter